MFESADGRGEIDERVGADRRGRVGAGRSDRRDRRPPDPGAEHETGAVAARRGVTGVDRQRTRDGWAVTAVHRTLIQTAEDPTGDAPAALAPLLAQLDLVNAAGVTTTSRDEDANSPCGAQDTLTTGAGRVRFHFAPFPARPPGRQFVDDAVTQPDGDRPIGHQVVDQATGIVQAQLGVSITEAAVQLHAHPATTHRPVLDAARDIFERRLSLSAPAEPE